MKSLLFKIGGMLLVGLLLPLAYYYITSEKPNVRYTISQGISASFVTDADSSSSYVIQEINVKNSGNKKAESIFLQLRSNILDYELSKNAEHDIAEVTNKKGLFEVKYNELVPDGQFRLIFKTIGPISSASVEVFDSRGKCKEIEQKTIGDIVESTYLGFWLAFLIVSLISGCIYSSSLWKGSLKYKKIEEILHKRKPFWVDKLAWYDEIKEAVTYNVDSDKWRHEIKSTFAYAFLDYDFQNIRIDKLVLQGIISYAAERFEKQYLEFPYFHSDEVGVMLKLQKPRNLPDEKWLRMHVEFQKKYIAYLQAQNISYENTSDYEKLLQESENIYVNDELKKQYEGYLQKNYLRRLVSDIIEISYFDPEKIEQKWNEVDNLSLSDELKGKYREFIKKVYFYILIKGNTFDEMTIYDKLLSTGYKDIFNEDEQSKIEKITYEVQLSAFERRLMIDDKIQKKLEDKEVNWLQEEDCNKLVEKVYSYKFDGIKRSTLEEKEESLTSGKLDWLKNDDKKKLQEEIKEKKELVKCQIYIKLFNKILAGEVFVGQKPAELSDDEWESVMYLYQRVQKVLL